MIVIDEEKCDRCNLCYKVCIGGPIFKGPEISTDSRILCVECGHCYAICPQDAITLEGFEDIEIHDLPERPPVDGPSMMALLRGRRSGRMYTTESVSREHVLKIIEAASLAPSGHNSHQVKAYVYSDEELISDLRERTIRFYKKLLRVFNAPGFSSAWRLIGLDPEELETLKYAFEGLWTSTKNEDILFYGSRTVLVFTAPKHNAIALGDAWIAAQNAVNYAEAIKVATCYNGYLVQAASYDARLRSAMKIPRGEKVVAVLNLGYPKHDFSREAPRSIMDITWI